MGVLGLAHFLLPLLHAIEAVNRYGTTYAKDGVPTGLNDAIVGHGNEAAVTEGLAIEIGGVVVVATHEDNPVVGLRHATAVLLDHLVIVARIVKAKSTIARHDEQCVAHGILYTEFMDELVELAMYVARHHNVLGIGETEGVYIACRCH